MEPTHEEPVHGIRRGKGVEKVDQETAKDEDKGLGNHLVLLSLYQSCEYKGVSFLRFLKSGMRDLDAFRERGKPGQGQGLPAIQLYPKGFTPPHILRQVKKRQASKEATQGDDAAPQGKPEPGSPEPAHIENGSTVDK